MKKTSSLALMFLLSFAPLAYAQEAADTPAASNDPTTSAPVTETTAAPDPTPAIQTPDAADAPAASATPDVPVAAVPDTANTEAALSPQVQDTVNTQDTVDGAALQGASNPEDLATTTAAVDAKTSADATSTPIVLDATSTPEIVAVDASTTLDVVAADVQPSDAVPNDAEPPQQDTPPDTLPSPQPQAVAIPVADLAPKPEYTFAMTGKRIAAKRIIRDAAGKTQAEDIAQTITPAIDNATGIMQVSGSCSNTYYVILLFKNQDDYARDPKSYILDKAYPCTGGNFSYQIADLPDTLSDGTYYLLAGEEGDKGPWAPITQLTEITINKNH